VSDGRQSTRFAGPLYVAAAMGLTGTTGTAQALAPDDVDPTAIGILRLLVGGPGLVALSARRLRASHRAAGSLPVGPMLVAMAAMAAYQPCFFGGTARSGVAVGTIVTMASAPLFAGILEPLLGRDRPDLRWCLTTAVAVVGVVLVVDPSRGADGGATGPLLSLGAGLAYAAFAHATKEVIAVHPPTAVMGVALTGAGLALAPALVVVDLDWLATGRGAGAVLHLGLVATTLAYVLYGRGLSRVPVAETTTLSLVEPLVAAILGLAVLGEAFSASMAVGAVLVVGSLLVVGSSRRATSW